MTNEFAAKCYRCGLRVAAGKGILTTTTSEHINTWSQMPRKFGRSVSLVEHPECAQEFAGTFYHHIYKPRIEK